MGHSIESFTDVNISLKRAVYDMIRVKIKQCKTIFGEAKLRWTDGFADMIDYLSS